MKKEAMNDGSFDLLLANINMETDSSDKKLERLFNSRGFFSAHQASRILFAFGIAPDKVRAIQIMEPRLCRMTCSEARDILSAFSIQNDKLKCFDSIKRVLTDSQSPQGIEEILNAFPYEADKIRALHVLQTVRSDAFDKVAAGGHQGYAALGGLYTQSVPLSPHLYGSVAKQQLMRPGQGEICTTIESSQKNAETLYHSHPSYAFPQGRDYANDRGYPGGYNGL